MRAKPKKLYGVAINDSETPVILSKKYTGNIKSNRARLVCPLYMSWSNMIKRCFSDAFKKENPAYKDVSVCQEWLIFSNFREWMLGQEWQDGCLDKDLLVPGNKIYSPGTCVFVSTAVNNFITERSVGRGGHKIGVSFHKAAGKYRSACSNPFTKKNEWLGLYDTEDEAHAAWLEKKLSHAKGLASMIDNKRLAAALVSRYENYNATVS